MSFLLPFIAFLEGFTTLSVEIVALRRFTPIIGSNSISTSIILGVILLALSYGYYVGGKNAHRLSPEKREQAIVQNMVIASMYYLFFTFILDITLLDTLLTFTGNFFFSILLASLILFFLPVFFASQTIPILSEMLAGDHTAEKVGKLLFYSTIGSFLGSVMTSSFLFPLIGVEKTAILDSMILSGIATLFFFKNIRKGSLIHFIALATFLTGLFMFLAPASHANGVIYEDANSYHTIRIYDTGNIRIFSQNGAFSSGLDTRTGESFFSYIQELKRLLVEKQYKNILIIGAAGFTLPNELATFPHVERVDVVDVDGSLREIAEQYFLEKRLSPKIEFFPLSARYFLRNTTKYYDAIVIDVYIGKSIPAEAATQEFFTGLRTISDNLYFNVITDAHLTSQFSRHFLATLNNTVGQVVLRDVGNFDTEKNHLTNFIVTNVGNSGSGYTSYLEVGNTPIYTDDLASIELDLFQLQAEVGNFKF